MRKVKKGEKILVLIWAVLPVLFSAILPLTGEPMYSASEYYGQPNQIYYILMYISMAMLMMLMNALYSKHFAYGLAGAAAFVALGADMWSAKDLHNISTAIFATLAAYSVVVYTSMRLSNFKIWVVSLLSVNFILSFMLPEGKYLMNIHMAELLVQGTFSGIIILDTFNKKYWGEL